MPRNTNIQLRKGTSSEWNSTNPVLASGEPGYDLTTKLLKIGDGSSNWINLSGINPGIAAGYDISITNVSGLYTIASTNLVHIDGKQPHGFVNRTDSVISLSGNIFTIAPTGASYAIYNNGLKIIKTGPESITIPSGTTQINYIHFNSDTTAIDNKTTPFDFTTDLPIAFISWNGSISPSGQMTFFAEERHGINMDARTQQWIHYTFGAQYISGLSIGNYVLNGNGSSNTHATFSISNGTIYQEDIQIDITDTTDVNLPFGQELNPIAQIPIYYHEGTTGQWVKSIPNDYAMAYDANGPQYNQLTGSTWTVENVHSGSQTRYFAVWVLATNQLDNPIISILGQRVDNTLNAAENNNSWSDVNLTNLPLNEVQILYRLIFAGDADYTNTPKARLMSILDLRTASIVNTVGTPQNDHGSLFGLGDDDHGQYVHIDNARTISAIHTLTNGITFDGNGTQTIAYVPSGVNITGGSGDFSSLKLNNSTVAIASRNLTAGSGLSGGGNLTSDRTFNIGQGDGINVGADNIAVDNTVIRTTGSQNITGSKTFLDTSIYFTNTGWSSLYPNTISFNPPANQTVNTNYNLPETTNGDVIIALTSNKITDFASCSSSDLAGKISDETGTGKLVFNNSPIFSGTVAVTGNVTINGTGVSVSGHAHTSSNISDFNSSVSGLLPVKNITPGTNIQITSTTGNYTISVTGVGGATISNYADNRILTSDGTTTGLNGESNLTFNGSVLAVTGSGTISNGLFLNDQTASTLASFDSNKKVVSLATSSYPSLTEIGYVKGLSSAIQTQINNKQDTITNPVVGTGTNNYVPKWNSASGLNNSVLYQYSTSIGIGTTTPTSALEVNGTITATGLNVQGSNLIVSNNGKVGVGITLPSGQLHVIGTGLFDSIKSSATSTLGSVISYTHPDNTELTNTDVIIAGQLELTRAVQQGIYNLAVESAWNGNGPLNTEWNSDGWSNIDNIKSRTYTSFLLAAGGTNNIGNNIVNLELIMKHVPTNRYWKVKFSSWTGGGAGGGFSYTRQEVTISGGSVIVEDTLNVSGNGTFQSKVGIGTTTNPVSPLEVNGYVTATGLIIQGLDLTAGGQLPSMNFKGYAWFGKADGSIGVACAHNTAGTFSSSSDFYTFTGINENVSAYKPICFTAGYFPQVYMHTNGNVGINTALPSGQLHVIGTGLFSNRIGIGINAPAYQLHVAGTGNFTGLLVNGTSVATSITASSGVSISSTSAGAYAVRLNAYSTTIGNGSSTSYTVTHNLNVTNDVNIIVRDTGTNYYVYPDVKYVNSNSVLIEFTSAPTSNQYRVSIIGF